MLSLVLSFRVTVKSLCHHKIHPGFPSIVIQVLIYVSNWNLLGSWRCLSSSPESFLSSDLALVAIVLQSPPNSRKPPLQASEISGVDLANCTPDNTTNVQFFLHSRKLFCVKWN